jgi:O-acetylserine/cysteine efflux transporter
MRPGDIALAVLAAVVWGLVFIAMKVGLRDAPPFLLTALRFAFAAVPAVFFVRPPKTAWRLVVLFGLFVGVAQFGLLFLAIELGMAIGLASLLMQLQAFITVGLAWGALGELPTAPQLAAGAIALVGLAVIGSARLGRAEALPFALTLIASTFWALGNLVTKYAGRIDAFAFVVWSSLVVPLPMLLLSLWTDGDATWRALLHPTLALGLSVAGLSWGGTLFSFGIWSWLLARYPAAMVGPFALLVPVVGMGSAWALFAEAPRPIELIGAVLIMAGLAFNVIGDRLIASSRRR